MQRVGDVVGKCGIAIAPSVKILDAIKPVWEKSAIQMIPCLLLNHAEALFDGEHSEGLSCSAFPVEWRLLWRRLHRPHIHCGNSVTGTILRMRLWSVRKLFKDLRPASCNQDSQR